MSNFISLSGRGIRNGEVVTTARVGKDEVGKILRDKYKFRMYSFALPLKMCCQILFGMDDNQMWNDKVKEQPMPGWELSPRRVFQRLGTEGGRLVFQEDMWPRQALLIKDDIDKGVSRIPEFTAAQSSIVPDEVAEVYASLSDDEYIYAIAKRAAGIMFQLSTHDIEESIRNDAPVRNWKFKFTEIVDGIINQTIPAVLDMPRDEALMHFIQIRRTLPVYDVASYGPYALPDGEPQGLVIPDCRFPNEGDLTRENGGIVLHVEREIPMDIIVVQGHASEQGLPVMPGDEVIVNDGTLQELRDKVDSFVARRCNISTDTPTP